MKTCDMLTNLLKKLIDVPDQDGDSSYGAFVENGQVDFVPTTLIYFMKLSTFKNHQLFIRIIISPTTFFKQNNYSLVFFEYHAEKDRFEERKRVENHGIEFCENLKEKNKKRLVDAIEEYIVSNS